MEGGNEEETEVREGNVVNNKEEKVEEEKAKDLEKGGVSFEGRGIQRNINNAENGHSHEDSQHSMYHRLNPTNPLRIVINSNTRVASPSPLPPHPPHNHNPVPPVIPVHPPPSSHPPPPPTSPPPESQPSETRSIPIVQPQVSFFFHIIRGLLF